MHQIFAPWPPLARPPPTLPERLAQILGPLRTTAGAGLARNPFMAPLVALLYGYIGGVMRRFDRLVAGSIGSRPARPRPPRPPTTQPKEERERPARKRRVPYRFGWVISMMGWRGAGYAAQLRAMLANDAELRDLMAASPRAGRLLRPLCRMLRIEPAADLPPSLFPPRVTKCLPSEPAPSEIQAVDVSVAALKWPAARDASARPGPNVRTVAGEHAPGPRRADEADPPIARENPA